VHDHPDIDDLLNKHASDKQSQNGYAPIYHALFKNLRDAPVQLLEIGIGTLLPNVYCSMYGHDLPGYRQGASLRAWRDYFANPEAHVYGMDVQPDTMIADEPRITTMLCNSVDKHSVREALALKKRFNIVVDDGSHIAEQQILTLKNIWPFLAANGLYVIEDVNRVDHNQGRILVDHKAEFDELLAEADALYFTVSLPKADVIVISARDCAP
jgi:hypothetical protein